MNLILTNHCNKGCPYCFAASDRKENIREDMTPEQVEEILNKNSSSDIKLLGGEPTLNPQFPEILKKVIQRNLEVTIISNFLFKQEIRDAIIENIYLAPQFIYFLANSTDLDQADRLQIFSSNYNQIYEAAYNCNQEGCITCGITIDETKDVSYYKNYLNFLKEALIKIPVLRISISFPGNKKDKDPKRIINNKKLGKIIKAIITWCYANGTEPTSDCVLFPCLFETKEDFYFIKKYMSRVRTHCTMQPGEGPFDLFSDGTLSFCYGTRELLSVNSNDFDSLFKAKIEVSSKYLTLEAKVKPSDTCQNCEFFKERECSGPCLSFYKPEDFEIFSKD